MDDASISWPPARGRGWRVAALALGTAVAALACSPTPRDPVTRGARAVDPEALAAYGRFLAADARAGRHHASPEADSVASDLLARLDGIGIGTVSQAQALRGLRAVAFAHHFSVSLQQLGDATRFAVADTGSSRDALLGDDFRPLVFSSETDVLAPTYRLAGRAEDQPAAAIAQLRGRVVLVPPSALRAHTGEPIDAAYYRTARLLSDWGAAAVVFTAVADWLQLPSASYPGALPPELVRAIGSPRGVRLNLTANRAAAALQAAAWRVAPERTIPALVLRPGWEVPSDALAEARVRVQFDDEAALGQNVLVGFGGAAPSDECILVVAHYDHSGVNSIGEILNGADDNASGVAALFEVARALTRVHDTLRRSVLLAFVSAEMQGGQGVETLLQDLPLLLGPMRVRACLVLDAVGVNDRDVLAIGGAVDHPDLMRVLERHNLRPTLDGAPFWLQPAPLPSAPAAFPAAWPHAGTMALLQQAGVPCLLLNDGLDPLLYGQPEDDWDGVNVQKVARVARLVFAATYELATRRGVAALPAAQSPR